MSGCFRCHQSNITCSLDAVVLSRSSELHLFWVKRKPSVTPIRRRGAGAMKPLCRSNPRYTLHITITKPSCHRMICSNIYNRIGVNYCLLPQTSRFLFSHKPTTNKEWIMTHLSVSHVFFHLKASAAPSSSHCQITLIICCNFGHFPFPFLLLQ